jgi:hypothetical protein
MAKGKTTQWPKEKRTKGQTKIYNTLHRKLKIEQHGPTGVESGKQRKNRQHNGQRKDNTMAKGKKNKRTNKDLQHTPQETKDRTTRTHGSGIR